MQFEPFDVDAWVSPERFLCIMFESLKLKSKGMYVLINRCMLFSIVILLFLYNKIDLKCTIETSCRFQNSKLLYIYLLVFRQKIYLYLLFSVSVCFCFPTIDSLPIKRLFSLFSPLPLPPVWQICCHNTAELFSSTPFKLTKDLSHPGKTLFSSDKLNCISLSLCLSVCLSI